MPNFDLIALKKQYKTNNIRVLISRMLKQHPEYGESAFVTYQVRDSGDTRLQVCATRDEVRQVFISPHCRDAITVRRGANGAEKKPDAA
ncbi:MAG: hypothetical protein ABR527_04935 [Gemmatimonadota bacterium]